MSPRRLHNRLYYFTVEDEGILAEAFARMDPDVYAITYKVTGTDDVFVTTTETRDAMDRADIAYNLLAEEDGTRISLYHSPLSLEELSDFDDAIKALGLAYRAIGMACVGVNGEGNLGFDLSQGTKKYTYFTAPAGHTFIWRLFHEKNEARTFLEQLTTGDQEAMEWVEALPMESSDQLVSYH
ncbi:MAG: hypothetical protein AAGD01_04635 [Acidobacteriota bacterium]